jgi:hypothetical protein
MDDKKRIKAALNAIGRPHVKLLREALTDQRAVCWLSEPRQMLGNKTPLEVIEAGNVEKVREIIKFCYDFSTLPPDEPVEEELAEDDD